MTISTFRIEGIDWLQQYIAPSDTLLDVGCGIMPVTKHIKCKYITGVDVWKPYIDQISNKLNRSLFKVLCFDVEKSLDTIMTNKFDIVVALDVMEYFEKATSLRLINEMERIASKKVIIFTPEGFILQDDGKGWGINNPEYQKHRCGFSHEEFENLGYVTLRRVGGDNPAILAIKEIPCQR